MKYLGFLIACLIGLQPLTAQDDPYVLFLVDPEDTELVEALGEDAVIDETPESESELQKYLQANRLPMNNRYQRLSDLAFKRQQRVVSLLDEFISTEFDPLDPEANPKFVSVTKEIVDLTFKAISEKDYYEILYIINQKWLEHLDQVERFSYLDRSMSAEDLRREERRNKIRKVATTISTLGGAALGAYGGYLASQKVVPIVAKEKTLSLLLKWTLGRGPLIIIGASVGAAAGSYLGFLGSNWLLWRQYTYVDPIDGNEDLRDILDIVDELP